MRRAESLSWPLKMLDRLSTPTAVIERLTELLAEMDTEYERDPQRKIQTLSALEERRDPRIAAGLVRFLRDANETARFHAASALLAQPEALEHKAALVACLLAEDSVRVRNRILEAFASLGWDVGPDADAVRLRLPAGYRLDARGIPHRA
jgi:HEAT repeat protein